MTDFNPTQDAYIDEANPTTNYNTTELKIGVIQGKTIPEHKYAYSTYDLTSLRGHVGKIAGVDWYSVSKVAGETKNAVSTASLTFKDCSVTGGTGWTIRSYECSTYNEATITWDTRVSGIVPPANVDYTVTSDATQTITGLATQAQDAIDNRSGTYNIYHQCTPSPPPDVTFVCDSSEGDNVPVLAVTRAGHIGKIIGETA